MRLASDNGATSRTSSDGDLRNQERYLWEAIGPF